MNDDAMTVVATQPQDSATVERLRSIFSQCFEQPFELFPRSLGPKDLRNWDSQRNVQLIMQIEEVFQLEFSGSEMARMQSVGAICDLIDAKRGK